MSDIGTEFLTLIQTGGWIAFAAFGTFLAYKLAFVTVISFSVIKVVHKLLDLVKTQKEDQNVLRLVVAAGYTWPLSPAEWDELIKNAEKLRT